jgi:site-specific DNA-methyltransferase (adenine-specific)
LKWGVGAINVGGCRVGGRHPAQFTMTCECEGEEHNSDCPVTLLDAQSGTIKGSKGSGLTPTKARSWKNASIAGINRVGYDDTGGASRFFYISKPSKKEKGDGNDHPTVKSIDLMKYLVTLVTPPGGTVLDPFAGSGTTGVACIELGCSFRGYEADEHNYLLAKERLEEAL